MGEEGLHNSYSVAVNGSTLEVPGRVAPTDGGAAFVLESKGDAFLSASLHRKPSPLAAGSWWHAGFHLTTAIVGPTILTLPYAFRGLAWGLGLASLTAVGAVTFYAYSLMSKANHFVPMKNKRFGLWL